MMGDGNNQEDRRAIKMLSCPAAALLVRQSEPFFRIVHAWHSCENNGAAKDADGSVRSDCFQFDLFFPALEIVRGH
jgi:hypothetical protein